MPMVSDESSGAGRAAKLATELLTRKLGRLGDYPETIVEQALQTYEVFVRAYIGIMRFKDPLYPADRTDSLQIDMAVVDEMRHFYSDYQHITRDFLRMDRLLSQLARTNRENQPQRYQQIIDEIRSPNEKADLMKGVMQ